MKAGRAGAPARRRTGVLAARPTGPSHPVHALQRAAGNRAVAGVLGGRRAGSASGPVAQRDDAADLRAFARHVRLLTQATVLNDLPEADRKARVAALSLAEVKNMLDAVPLTSLHHVRGELLSRMYDHSVAHRQWADAVRYLNGFDDPGITSRVELLRTTRDDLRELIVAALRTPRVLNLIRSATGLAIDEQKPFGELRTDGFAAKQEGRFTDADAGTITITFVPNPDLVNADAIAFVQTIRRVYTGTDSTAKYAYGMDDRATGRGTAVDRFGKRRLGWFGYQDSGASGSSTEGVCVPGTAPTAAVMTDTPGKIRETDNLFETCAIAKAGTDTGRRYGCLTWGFTVDAQFGVTPKPIEVRLETSSEFQAAVGNWNAQAAGTVGGGTPGQQALPPAK